MGRKKNPIDPKTEKFSFRLHKENVRQMRLHALHARMLMSTFLDKIIADNNARLRAELIQSLTGATTNESH